MNKITDCDWVKFILFSKVKKKSGEKKKKLDL